MNVNTISQMDALWKEVLAKICEENDKKVFDAFFLNTKIHSVDGSRITVICDTQLTKEILADKYASYVDEKVYNITGTNYKTIYITNEDLSRASSLENDLSTNIPFFENVSIDPSFNFDTFVVGPSNTEAQKASLIVATSPGTMFQTLFIYGASGLGKTHLLCAIGNYIKENTPEKKILYCSSQDFINEYLDFVNGDNKKEQLIKYLKRFDVFLIDDIQMLKDKKKTQEFFFNIYEDFRQNHKQVVLTSDKLPGELDGIDARLITRFTSGLAVPVYKPDSKTCKEILEKKIVLSGFELSRYDEDVLLFMADKFKDSIRSLEGALVRLNFYASLNRVDHIDLNLCTSALQGLVDVSDAKSKVNEQKILNTVASYYNISVNQLTGKIKVGNIANARHIAIYLVRDLLDLPYKKIGKLFSNRDHTTIMHSVEKVEGMLKTDKQVSVVINELKTRLQS